MLVNSLRRLFDADLEANFEAPNFGGEFLALARDRSLLIDSLATGQPSPVVQAMLALLERDGGLY